MTAAGADGATYQLQMRKGDPGYSVLQRRTLFAERGTKLKVKPLLAGIRQFSGEKIQWYLASELRDRIRQSGVLPVGQSRTYRAVARDRSRHLVEHGLSFQWEIAKGSGQLENDTAEIVTFTAPAQPDLMHLKVTATQGEIVCEGEGMVTVTDSLLPELKSPASTQQGLPGYTFKRAPGELWRSQYNADQNVIVVNNGHRDFIYASKNQALKLRYICRLFTKELVCKNFPALSTEQILERMIELSLYTEENLK